MGIDPDSPVAHRLQPFGTTIFAEMTALAHRVGAVNLSQGFPDFDGPEFVKAAAREAIASGGNQYTPMAGLPELRASIARWAEPTLGGPVDPMDEVTVTAGCTGALAAVMLGLVNEGDEVVLFEPYYDSYRACVAMAGARPKFVALREQSDGFAFDPAELRGAVSPRTRVLVLNSPHNPTGKVFSRQELEQIADVCRRHDVLVVSDEVYERITFERDHVSIASLPGMRERTIVCSSLGKTFSLTGWKIGWTIAPPELTRGVRATHQFLTFCVPGPLQIGAAMALDRAGEYVPALIEGYRSARDRLSAALVHAGFEVKPSAGTYFLMADHTPVSRPRQIPDDVAFARFMAERVGVAVIPPSAFYERKKLGKTLVRFAFCKTPATIDAAIERLGRIP